MNIFSFKDLKPNSEAVAAPRQRTSKLARWPKPLKIVPSLYWNEADIDATRFQAKLK